MQPAVLKPLTPCKLEIHYLYTKEFQIRFDKTAVERVHAIVTRRETPGILLFSVVLGTEEARGIYRELRRRGAAPNPSEAAC